MRRALMLGRDSAVRDVVGRVLNHVGVSLSVLTRLEDGDLDLGAEVDLVIVAAKLDRERYFSVLRHLKASLRMPEVIILAESLPATLAFELAQHGVAAYVQSPVSATELAQVLQPILVGHTPLQRIAREQVGRLGAKEAQRLVREAMFDEALQRSEGNRTLAARLLQVDRRYVQMMARLREESCP